MTKSFFYFLLSIFIISSCSNTDKKQQSNSESFANNVSGDTVNLSKFSDSLFLVSSGQMSPFKTINIDNINFQVVRDSEGDTNFIGTWDKSFVTPEGYKVGMSLQQIKMKYRDKIQKEPGWGYYIELPSKWNLQFVVGKTTTDHAPADSNKVSYIFKRR